MELRLLLDDDDETEPHPLLVACQDITAADVIMAAMRTGWLSDDRVFAPAVEAGRDAPL